MVDDAPYRTAMPEAPPPAPGDSGAARPPSRPRMKWWVKGLIASGLWIALTIGIGIFHTEVILAGKLTKAQDIAISEQYGTVCAIGLVLIWLIAAAVLKVREDFRSRLP
jgi:hypothetical protein